MAQEGTLAAVSQLNDEDSVLRLHDPYALHYGFSLQTVQQWILSAVGGTSPPAISTAFPLPVFVNVPGKGMHPFRGQTIHVPSNFYFRIQEKYKCIYSCTYTIK